MHLGACRCGGSSIVSSPAHPWIKQICTLHVLQVSAFLVPWFINDWVEALGKVTYGLLGSSFTGTDGCFRLCIEFCDTRSYHSFGNSERHNTSDAMTINTGLRRCSAGLQVCVIQNTEGLRLTLLPERHLGPLVVLFSSLACNNHIMLVYHSGP